MKSLIQTYKFLLNGKAVQVRTASDKPLLWVLRDELKIKGTKYGCGMSTCGACTVHINNKAVRSCVMPISLCQDQAITTVEGLSEDLSHPVQQAWKRADVPQCGYCQSGQMMQAASMLNENVNPTKETISQNMSQVVCRCGTYPRIKKAINIAVELISKEKAS